jgi:hypothetical protein
VPLFVAILVWLLRILIIGSFSMASNRVFVRNSNIAPLGQKSANPVRPPRQDRTRSSASGFQPAPKPTIRNGKTQQRPMATRPHRSP